MLVSQIIPVPIYPHVEHFFKQVLDLHFSDARAMLQLPRPKEGINSWCNFTLAGTLCNILSGLSTTLYKPVERLSEVASEYSTGKAFQELVRNYFPNPPPGPADFPGQLYEYARNPLVHSLAIQNIWPVTYCRVLHHPHPDEGWADKELNDLECLEYTIQNRPSFVITAEKWTIHCDCFYFDVIELLRRLTRDEAQMQAAEDRFRQHVHMWWRKQRGRKKGR